MDDDIMQRLTARIEKLETRLQMFYVLGLALGAVLIFVSVTPATRAQDPAPAVKLVRAKTIIIEDEHGRDRIVMGAPVPNPKEGQRRSASTGLVINDANGYERFGLGLRTDGSVGMGFDAPPGTGDPRNRERINIVADSKGGAFLRFLNRRTEAAGFLRLDDDDRLALDFLNFTDKSIETRRLTFAGERTSEQKK
jgi:hypothetical protein